MNVRILRHLWATSADLYKDKELPVAIARRVSFVLAGVAAYDCVKPLLTAPPHSSLGKLMRRRPETVGAVVWPYQCIGWNARTRLKRIHEHFKAVDALGEPFDFAPDNDLTLLDLREIQPDFRVVVDQPVWFLREGQLAINLFLGETRIYTLAYSFFFDEGALTAFVGAIQGRNIDGILNTYRDLTKAAHGMRPRDLLIELFRMHCAELGIGRFYAVADAYRQHRSAWFGEINPEKIVTNYDEIWQDRGGVRIDPMRYRFDVMQQKRDVEAIPAKKRKSYQRRYEMLDSLRRQMRDRFIMLRRHRTPAARAG